MEKIQTKLLPLGALTVFLAKVLITNTINLTDVLLIAILAALTVFYETRAENTELKNLKAELTNLQENQKIQEKTIDTLKTQLASIQITGSLRGLGTR